MGFTGFYWVLLGFTGFYWVSQGIIGFYRDFLYCKGFHWDRVGCYAIHWPGEWERMSFGRFRRTMAASNQDERSGKKNSERLKSSADRCDATG